MKATPLCLLAATSVLVSGCDSIATKEKSEKATASAIGQQTDGAPDLWVQAANSANIKVAWLDSFKDRTLKKFVEEAQANNKDLQASAAGVEQARALAIQAGAALKPKVGLSAGNSSSGNLESSSSNTNSVNLGLQVSWEVDLWGRIRAGKRAATASYEAVLADYEFAQHSIAAATSKAYFAAIETNRQTEVIEQTIEALQETERIVKAQYENGLATGQDLALTRSDLATSRDRLITIQGSQRDASRALELLLGRYPSAELDVKATLPAPPTNPPAGLPSELLERRPDIVAAERRVAAAFDSEAQAKAARLPSLSLTGTLGGSSEALSSILNPQNLAWQAGASLVTPIIDGGVRKAQVDIATAEQKQAVAAYGQVALKAFSEVEQNLDQGVVLRERKAALQIALKEAEKAYTIAKVRHEEGETDLLDRLAVQQRVIAAESNLVTVQRLLLDQRVNLNLALGGDWK
jgi:NodT family efflux transporter outer membrane factor (OMF) lipoprotein